MFTGIVTHIGRIRGVEERDGGRLFLVEPPFDPRTLELGASVAHDGVCLTVCGHVDGGYLVHAVRETLARTTLASWTPGRRVNLERSLRLGDELGGHLVFGHVDATGEVLEVAEEGSMWRMVVGIPRRLAPLVAVKGSIAVDGVSLTVTGAADDRFAVALVPHTREVTTLGERRPGDRVNVEVDMLARYVARQLECAGLVRAAAKETP
ncbi:Riboflavin synthase [bacterium HR39]|nr:Riboflavin synthase [bacterium HR39]